MTEDFKTQFLAERVRALAMVLLTRRDDLEIRPAKDETGVDYLVYLVRENVPAQRPFGVYLRGTMTPVTIANANAQLKPSFGEFHRLGGFPYPVCLFYFTMRDNAGYYTWLLEPVVTEQGVRLRDRTAPDCRPLNEESLSSIIAQVAAWYDSLYAELSA